MTFRFTFGALHSTHWVISPFTWVNMFSAEWLHYPAFFQQNLGILTASFFTFPVSIQACSVSAETIFLRTLRILHGFSLGFTPLNKSHTHKSFKDNAFSLIGSCWNAWKSNTLKFPRDLWFDWGGLWGSNKGPWVWVNILTFWSFRNFLAKGCTITRSTFCMPQIQLTFLTFTNFLTIQRGWEFLK